ncbi:MAG: DNA primase [Clostridia bacterium]|nr:DNA primase [Clostridia bacterium]
MATALQEFLITLKEKVNIVDVAGGYLTLEKRGASYWACCPFHHEKTPSFSINEADQYYHCFGCGESGDVIKFVRELENIDFMDAVKMLAERAHLTLPQTGFDNQKTVELKRKRDTLLKLMNDCAHFYLDNLNSGKAEEHVNYILKRNIPSNIVRTFGLGASLNFTDLPKFLLAKGYTKQDMIDSGAVNEVDGRLTDAQGGRLIYPVINAMDEVVAFGGRVLKKTDFAKYKNTKETLLFNKGKTLYNINLLKKLRKTQTIREVIMVEGYMDTISLYQAGFKNVVASMGTSLTQEQARLIKRYTDTVLISYDGDGAGQKANMRGLEILKSEGINVKVVPLPEGLDPDDVIKQRGAEGYKKCLDSAMPLIDYKLTTLNKGFDLSKTEDKRKFVSEALKIVRTADSAAEQEELLKQLRDRTGITYESLSRDLNAVPAPQKTEQEEKPVRKDVSNVYLKASRFVIASYLFGARFTAQSDMDEIPFEHEVHTIIAKYLKSKKLMEERVQPAELFEFFDEKTDEYAELCKILDLNDGDALAGEVAEKYFNDCVKKLKLKNLDGLIASLTSEIEKQTSTEERKALTQNLLKLIKQKEKLKSGDK